MHILILEHEPETPPALFGEWAQSRGHEQTVALVPAIASWPDPREYDAVVSLGSDTSVHADPQPWVKPELHLLRTAHASDVPVLGICFGAQALSQALGGRVTQSDQAEARWGLVETDGSELILPGPWFLWHADEFSPPPEATLLAGTPRQTTAFAHNRSLGVQFHPEVDGQLALAWISGGRAKLTHQGIDPRELTEQIEGHGPGARGRAFAQFDRIANWWSECSESLSH